MIFFQHDVPRRRTGGAKRRAPGGGRASSRRQQHRRVDSLPPLNHDEASAREEAVSAALPDALARKALHPALAARPRGFDDLLFRGLLLKLRAREQVERVQDSRAQHEGVSQPLQRGRLVVFT